MKRARMTFVLAPRPFVQVACVCERVLVETDNVPSLIRIADTYHLELPQALPADTAAAVNLTVYVSLKSGDVVGEHEIGLKLNRPDGLASEKRPWPAEFRGEAHGVSLRLNFTIANPAYGLYWFDVLWDGDEILTRIPLRLTPPKTLAPTVDSVPIGLNRTK